MRRAFYDQLDVTVGTVEGLFDTKLPWPKKGQKLLRPPTKRTPENARAVVHWLNHEYASGLKDITYKDAGDLLTEAVLHGGDGTDPDRFAFPILYLYRHATELLLKDIIREGVRLGVLNADEVEQPLNEHALYRLWNLAKRAISELPGPKEDVQAAEGLISELHQADPDGQSLRYDRDKLGKTNVVKLPGTVDLAHMRRVFQGLWGFLQASAGMLSEAGHD